MDCVERKNTFFRIPSGTEKRFSARPTWCGKIFPVSFRQELMHTLDRVRINASPGRLTLEMARNPKN